MTKCNGQRDLVARNQCNANEICMYINFSAYEMVHMYRIKYQKLNYKQFSFLTLNNEDKRGKDPKRFPQHGKASLICTNSLDYLFRKTNFNVVLKIFQNQIFTLCLSQTSFSKLSTESLN